MNTDRQREREEGAESENSCNQPNQRFLLTRRGENIALLWLLVLVSVICIPGPVWFTSFHCGAVEQVTKSCWYETKHLFQLTVNPMSYVRTTRAGQTQEFFIGRTKYMLLG